MAILFGDNTKRLQNAPKFIRKKEKKIVLERWRKNGVLDKSRSNSSAIIVIAIFFGKMALKIHKGTKRFCCASLVCSNRSSLEKVGRSNTQ
jgi:hypothetical protein